MSAEPMRAEPLLSLVAAGLPAAAGLLKLAALAAHVGLGVRVGHAGGAAVLDGLARVLGAAQQNAVGACGRHQRQLVKGQDLAASLCQPHTARLDKMFPYLVQNAPLRCPIYTPCRFYIVSTNTHQLNETSGKNSHALGDCYMVHGLFPYEAEVLQYSTFNSTRWAAGDS